VAAGGRRGGFGRSPPRSGGASWSRGWCLGEAARSRIKKKYIRPLTITGPFEDETFFGLSFQAELTVACPAYGKGPNELGFPSVIL
jgi:hypothetical protein